MHHHSDDGTGVPLVQRDQNSGGRDGPFMNLGRDTVPAGPDPGRLDQWIAGNHPPDAPIERSIQDTFPVTSVGDPWYYHPIPDAPGLAETPQGRPLLPTAIRAPR